MSAPRPQETCEIAALIGAGMDPIVNLAEAAEYVGCHDRTLRRAVDRRELACIKKGGLFRFRISHLDAWLKKSEKRPSKVQV